MDNVRMQWLRKKEPKGLRMAPRVNSMQRNRMDIGMRKRGEMICAGEGIWHAQHIGCRIFQHGIIKQNISAQRIFLQSIVKRNIILLSICRRKTIRRFIIHCIINGPNSMRETCSEDIGRKRWEELCWGTKAISYENGKERRNFRMGGS